MPTDTASDAVMTPERFITAARGWLGTPFHHQGLAKGVGCDCAGLIVGVAQELGLTDFLPPAYGPTPSPALLKRCLDGNLRRVANDEDRPADILVLKFTRDPQHLGIRTDIGILHSWAGARMVVEHNIDPVWQRRIVAVYRFPEFLGMEIRDHG